MGIAGVGMGVVIAMGLTMLLGFYYTPLHGVMVYLCLGIPWNPLIVSIIKSPYKRADLTIKAGACALSEPNLKITLNVPITNLP